MPRSNTFSGIGGHHSNRPLTEDWLTPPSIIAALGGSGSFDLDPCASVGQPWPTARRMITIEENGLACEWRGRIWMNPPYSAHKVGRWLGRMSAHNRGIALIFARTETSSFFRYVWSRASALLFMQGRINFHLPDGRRASKNAGAPSVLCAYGRDDADVLSLCSIAGQFVPLALPRLFSVAVRRKTWREALIDWMLANCGEVRLADLYRAFAKHPNTRQNRNWQAKLRQELQRGPFERVGRGTWRVKHEI